MSRGVWVLKHAEKPGQKEKGPKPFLEAEKLPGKRGQLFIPDKTPLSPFTWPRAC
jgi:hypothetical protein